MNYLQLHRLAKIYRAKYYYYDAMGTGSIARCFRVKLIKTINELKEIDKNVGTWNYEN